ncbi:DUF1638 domain-containing protein [Chloroflexota bacterium]
MEKKQSILTRIVACEVFRPAIEYLQMEKRYPSLRVTYLPSNLHLRPAELKKRMVKVVKRYRDKNERVVCLYGDCFPEIDDFCEQHKVIKVPGHYCYEMLLGEEKFAGIINEVAGTYFAERELLTNFRECCAIPLELDDEEMRNYCFKQYRKLLYIRQPEDPNLDAKADEVAKFLGLYLDISDADYQQLEEKLESIL